MSSRPRFDVGQFQPLVFDSLGVSADPKIGHGVVGPELQDLVAFLGDLHAARIDLYLHQQGIDTTTPSGKAMFQMLGVFAEFERA
jgi:DNA invertase Pin-like site-specific DNA recombinase